ncbi:MAG: protein kinase [Bacilli bacterium]|nr:protein kinase [Bacilli bacterium]
MLNDKILKTFNSGQKEVTLVENKEYGICIRKIKKENTSTRRIIREIEIQNKFDCDYYPRLYFSDITSDQMLIYEEYIEGKDLSDIFKENNYFKNDENSCLNLLKELLTGLNYIWNESIVHRDLKPQNIIIRDNGIPVILDLGIAKILDGSDSTTKIWFSEGYAPIEQFTGQTKLIDKRTDFFSLGVIIFELFFGIRLFKSNDDVINKSPDYNLANFNNSKKFYNILKKLLGKRVFERYRKVDDIICDINKALERSNNE